MGLAASECTSQVKVITLHEYKVAVSKTVELWLWGDYPSQSLGMEFTQNIVVYREYTNISFPV